MNTEMNELDRLAERLRAVPAADPGPAARTRAWNLVAARLPAKPTVVARRSRPGRLVLALVAAVALLLVGTAAAAAQSLPTWPLYPIKRFDESVRATVTLGAQARFTYRLELARVRLAEAQAMLEQGRLDLVEAALDSYEADLAQAAAEAEDAGSADLKATLDRELQQAIEVHDAQLAQLQANVTNPAAQAAIQKARDRALNTAPPALGPKNPQDKQPQPTRH